jgi:L-serine deaminase
VVEQLTFNQLVEGSNPSGLTTFLANGYPVACYARDVDFMVRAMFLSIFDIFKIGVGPSSSHTMGPMTAAARFLDDLRGGREKEPGAGDLAALACSLHGSLAFTGKGHATDRAVILGLSGSSPRRWIPTGRRCWRRRCARRAW